MRALRFISAHNNSLNFMLFCAIIAHYCCFCIFLSLTLWTPRRSCNFARAFLKGENTSNCRIEQHKKCVNKLSPTNANNYCMNVNVARGRRVIKVGCGLTKSSSCGFCGVPVRLEGLWLEGTRIQLFTPLFAVVGLDRSIKCVSDANRTRRVKSCNSARSCSLHQWFWLMNFLHSLFKENFRKWSGRGTLCRDCNYAISERSCAVKLNFIKI